MQNLGRKKRSFLLYLFLAIFLVKGLFYALYAMPFSMGSSPDDVGHVSYVIYMYINKDMPILWQTPLEKTVMQNYADATLYGLRDESAYQIDLQEYEEVTEEEVEALSDENIANNLNWIAQHPPLYYLYMLPFVSLTAIFTSQLSYLLLAMRLGTLILGLITIVLIYKGLTIMDMGKLSTLCIMTCITFSHPIQYYLTTVNNDAMVICLSAAAFVLFVGYMKERKRCYIYLFSLICGLITITKYTGAIVLPIYIFMFMFEELMVNKTKFSVFVKHSFICALIFLAVTVPILTRNYYIYGTMFPMDGSNESLYPHTLYYFMANSGYFDELYRHMLALTGFTRYLMRADNYMMMSAAFIVILLYILKSVYRTSESKDNYRYAYISILSASLIICSIISVKILNMEWSTASAVMGCMGIFILSVIPKDKNWKSNEYRYGILSVSLVIFYVSVFFIRHYTAYLHWNRTKAMHGRYYYILLIPFFGILYHDMDKHRERYPMVRFLPIVLLILSEMSEIVLLWKGIRYW